MNRRQMLATTLAGAATIAISGGESFAQRVPTVADVLYDKEIPVLGNPNGNVTIVEYFDYQCPYCKKGHAELMRVVEKDGNVRLVLKDWIILVTIRPIRRVWCWRQKSREITSRLWKP